MEKLSSDLPSDYPLSWATYDCTPTATDACDFDLYGTPGEINCVDLSSSTGPVVINEVAWMGSLFWWFDEWIELHNISDEEVDIASWSVYGLQDGACLNISAFAVNPLSSTVIPPGGYLIIGDNFTIFRNGTKVDLANHAVHLKNAGGQIVLYDAPDCTGNVVDVANDGGPWYAGGVFPYKTMERIWPHLTGVSKWNWHDFIGTPFEKDRWCFDINGSPRIKNSVTP
jgi:hypothetical protein